MKKIEAVPQGRIKQLDGLRAFAVLFVVIYHMVFFSGSIVIDNSTFRTLIGHLGGKGVDIFFVISGYIITTLLIRESESGTVSLKAFYIRRVLRIFPPFLLYISVISTLAILGVVTVPLSSVLWSLLFLGNTSLIGDGDWLVKHSWSLSVEEQFYLFAPVLLCTVLRFNRSLIAIWLIPFYTVCVCSMKMATELGQSIGPIWHNLSMLFYFRHIAVGVLIASNAQFLTKRIRSNSLLFPLSLFSVSLLPVFLNFSFPLNVAYDFLEPFFLGTVVFWFIANPDRCTALNLPVIQLIGRMSYSIYLWQQLFTAPAGVFPHFNLSESLALSAITILAVSYFSYVIVERPFIKIGRKLSESCKAI